jgi:hypothetical protein
MDQEHVPSDAKLLLNNQPTNTKPTRNATTQSEGYDKNLNGSMHNYETLPQRLERERERERERSKWIVGARLRRDCLEELS